MHRSRSALHRPRAVLSSPSARITGGDRCGEGWRSCLELAVAHDGPGLRLAVTIRPPCLMTSFSPQAASDPAGGLPAAPHPAAPQAWGFGWLLALPPQTGGERCGQAAGASETGIRRKGPSGFSRIQIAWCAGRWPTSPRPHGSLPAHYLSSPPTPSARRAESPVWPRPAAHDRHLTTMLIRPPSSGRTMAPLRPSRHRPNPGSRRWPSLLRHTGHGHNDGAETVPAGVTSPPGGLDRRASRCHLGRLRDPGRWLARRLRRRVPAVAATGRPGCCVRPPRRPPRRGRCPGRRPR